MSHVLMDSALTSVDPLLDEAKLRAWLSPVTHGTPGLSSARVRYVRAKHRRSALLGLELTWRGQAASESTHAAVYLSTEGTTEATAKARTLRLLEPARGPAVTSLRDPDGLYLAFPNDRAMRGLSAAADTRRLGNRLLMNPFPFAARGFRPSRRRSSVRVCRWKPGRRAVLEASIRFREANGEGSMCERFFVRVYPANNLLRQVDRWRAIGRMAECPAPEIVGVDHERGFILTRAMEGAALRADESVHGRFFAKHCEVDAALIAEALARIHAARPDHETSLPVIGIEETLAAAIRVLEDLATWMPEMRPRIASVVRRLVAARPASAGTPALVHGDFKLDQILSGPAGLSILDWDETAIGPPVLDFASFEADRLLGPDAAEDMLERSVGRVPAHCSDAVWRWFVACAMARRSLFALQAGRVDWRDLSLRAIHMIERAVPPRTTGCRATTSERDAASTNSGRDALLRRLLVPSQRGDLVGVHHASLALRAVWPVSEGFTARLEARNGDDVWIECGDATTCWYSATDPELPRLEQLVASGRYTMLAHRFGRRAALQERNAEGNVLHLRPSRRAGADYEKLQRVQRVLDRAGIPSARLIGPVPEGDGWRTHFIAGESLDRNSAPRVWRLLGTQLATLHAQADLPAFGVRGLLHARDAAVRQVALTKRAGLLLGRWLSRELESWSPASVDGGAPSALVHGDLHPAQVIVAERVVVLDWDQAGVSNPEEDLGNLAAHLYWRHGSSIRTKWRLLSQAYRAAGGRIDRALLVDFAWLSLLRLLAVHGWRDEDRARCEARRSDWLRWREEVVKW